MALATKLTGPYGIIWVWYERQAPTPTCTAGFEPVTDNMRIHEYPARYRPPPYWFYLARTENKPFRFFFVYKRFSPPKNYFWLSPLCRFLLCGSVPVGPVL